MLNVGMLLYPKLTQLDLTGPYEVLHRLPNAQIHLAWKTLDPVVADSGLGIVPNTRLIDCPRLDVLFVPGGAGQIGLMDDGEVLNFIRTHGQDARYVTSVCTGALLLGAAGLLDGYRATTHWAYMELLPRFGARPMAQRVVVDHNRVTGGGVTAGMDFAFRLAAELAGETFAKAVQLALEYNPAPPFPSGHPDVAEPEITALVRARLQSTLEVRKSQGAP